MNEDYSRSPDRVLASEKVVAGRKIFFLDYKENNRGRVLKITEDVNGRRDTIMIPDEALTRTAPRQPRARRTTIASLAPPRTARQTVPSRGAARLRVSPQEQWMTLRT